MNVFLLGIGIILSQFYIFESGIPQPAHYLIILAVIGSFFNSSWGFIVKNKDLSKPLLGFILYQAAVNFVYFLVEWSWDFIIQSTYIIYGFFVSLLIIVLTNKWQFFLNKIAYYCLGGLGVTFILAIFELGDYKFYPRYNAFFNDPNQMAFWVLCVSSILIFHFSRLGNVIVCAIVFFVSSYLIILTASRSGLLGYLILTTGFLIRYSKGFKIKIKGAYTYYYLSGVVMLIYGVYYLLTSESEVLTYLTNRVEVIDAGEQAEVRGYTRILDFPEYLILGSGHGLDTRFNPDGLEMHSTWAGVIFYYGLPGILLLLSGLYRIIRKLKLSDKLIFFAPLFYSFSTFGLRTPIFWIYLGFFYASVSKNRV